jgi:hypothetical protein
LVFEQRSLGFLKSIEGFKGEKRVIKIKFWNEFSELRMKKMGKGTSRGGDTI